MSRKVVIKTEIELDLKPYEYKICEIKNMSRDEAIKYLLATTHATALIGALSGNGQQIKTELKDE
jgi:hypothetical protein